MGECLRDVQKEEVQILYDLLLGGVYYHKSWDFIIKELNKCILVCSNCHTEIHEKLDNER